MLLCLMYLAFQGFTAVLSMMLQHGAKLHARLQTLRCLDSPSSGGLPPAGTGAAAGPTQPSVAGSLRSIFAPGANASNPGTGGACPFYLGPTTGSNPLLPTPGEAMIPAVSAIGSAAAESAPSFLTRCPFSTGSKEGNSKAATLVAAGSRPATVGSACPINLNTEGDPVCLEAAQLM